MHHKKLNDGLMRHLSGHNKDHTEKTMPDSAFVIGRNQLQRSMLITQLREMGVAHISQTPHLGEARRHIESRRVDMIICDYEMEKGVETAQTMLDDLRRCGLISISTIVVFLSSYGTYQKVSEAAESGIDVYLLMPFSYQTLHDRLAAAQKRRVELKDIYQSLEAKDFDKAAELCLDRYVKKSYGWLYAARIAAEIFIKQGKAKQAQEIYNNILSCEALPWAKIGLGRTQAEIGALDNAIETLHKAVKDHPDQTDAYDVMGRVYLEKGEPEKALEIYKLAVEATPHSVSRLQRLGFAAIHTGDKANGIEMLRRSVKAGVYSKMFDPKALFLLSVEEMDVGSQKNVEEYIKMLVTIMKQRTPTKRLDLILQLMDIVSLLAGNQIISARFKIENLLDDVLENYFDSDAATCLVVLLSIIAEKGHAANSDAKHIENLGLRFSHSNFCSAWLVQHAIRHPPYQEPLNNGFKTVFEQCRAAMTLTVQKKHAEGIDYILKFAEKYKNIKAIETAEGMIKRNAENLENADAFNARVNALKIDNDPTERRHFPANGFLRHPGGISLPG